MNVTATHQAGTLADEAWLEAHFQENYGMLQAIGRLFLGGSPANLDLIDESIQEVFERLWQKRGQLRSHPNVDAWLVESLRRQLLGHVSKAARRRRRAAIESYDDPDSPALVKAEQSTYPNPGDILEGQERYALLAGIVGQENAAIFYAFCVLNYSAKELSEQYGISEACIWTRISRSKKRILQRADLFFALMIAFILRI